MQITEHAISAEDISGLRSLIQEADLFGSNQAAHAAHRLRICIEVGGKLESWKAAIPRGQWETWCDEMFPDFNKVTRCRWMRVHAMHSAGKLDLESSRGIRHAYSLIGILPDSEASGNKSTKTADTWLTHLTRLMHSLELIQIEDLSEPEKNNLAERLDVVTKFSAKLRATNASQAA
ncbi:MAG: hypothetical protein IPK22_11470 [Verrucomicrobiaceae bacterium]|nr:hypothetical protein [Verrucomicrobiaceae bacterium]